MNRLVLEPLTAVTQLLPIIAPVIQYRFTSVYISFILRRIHELPLVFIQTQQQQRVARSRLVSKLYSFNCVADLFNFTLAYSTVVLDTR